VTSEEEVSSDRRKRRMFMEEVKGDKDAPR
jgi:hypothetical protein